MSAPVDALAVLREIGKEPDPRPAARAMVAAGASRIGTSSSPAIVAGARAAG